MRLCAHNPHHPISDEADPRQLYCSNACKIAAYRLRETRKREKAEAALRAVTAAVYFGERTNLDRAVLDAERVLAAIR